MRCLCDGLKGDQKILLILVQETDFEKGAEESRNMGYD